jgi:hypothetical protein
MTDSDMLQSLTLRRDFLAKRIEKAAREGKNLSHDKREAGALTRILQFYHDVMRLHDENEERAEANAAYRRKEGRHER